MNHYVIGIIDEDHADVDSIIRTIIFNKPPEIEESQIQFTPFSTNALDTSFNEAIGNYLLKIEEKQITALIIDYKIINNASCIKGTDVLKKVEDEVAKFPLIILSNVPDDCYDEFVDADKVYSKHLFFKIEEQYSKEKTKNIFRNMDHYLEIRSKLEVQHSQSMEKMMREGTTPEVINEIVETEKLLANYTPQHQTSSETLLDISDLQSAVELLREVDTLLDGGNNEN